MPRFVRLSLTLGLFLHWAAAFGAPATDPTAPGPDQDSSALISVRERILRMTDFLDTILPGTLGKQNIALHFTPKFSDVRDQQFVRYPLEIRYGATDQLELIGGMNPFSPNPIRHGPDQRWGPGEFTFGGRYDLSGPLFFYDKATIGIDNRIPIGKPPLDLNNGYTHVRPWLATTRVLRSHPNTTFYTNFSYDRAVKLTHREPPPATLVTRQHIIEIAPGLLYKPNEWGYFAEYRFRHFEEPTDTHLGHEYQVGTIWDVPIRQSAAWHLPGKFTAELGLRYTTEEGRGHSAGVTARVNWRTTLREVLTQVGTNHSSQ